MRRFFFRRRFFFATKRFFFFVWRRFSRRRSGEGLPFPVDDRFFPFDDVEAKNVYGGDHTVIVSGPGLEGHPILGQIKTDRLVFHSEFGNAPRECSGNRFHPDAEG